MRGYPHLLFDLKSNMNFESLVKADFPAVQNILFDILHGNMSLIVPTDHHYEQNREIWTENVWVNMCNPARYLLLIKDTKIIGFFMYKISEDTFYMEEMQLSVENQRQGIFKLLIQHFEPKLADIKMVDAYANKKNIRSAVVLRHIGLVSVGENENNIHFQGNTRDLLNWAKSR